MNRGDPEYKRAVNMLVHSVYPPSILHWMRVLGREKVKVVASERFGVSLDQTSREVLAQHLISSINFRSFTYVLY